MDLVALSQETVRLSKTLLEKLQAQSRLIRGRNSQTTSFRSARRYERFADPRRGTKRVAPQGFDLV